MTARNAGRPVGYSPGTMGKSRLADAKRDLALWAGIELAAEPNPLLNFRLSDMRTRALKALIEWAAAEQEAGARQVTLPVLSRPAREPPDELRFTVPGEPVPSQMRTVLPGGGVAYSKQADRARQFRDHVRLRAMMAINVSGWRAAPDETFAVELRAFVGNARTIDVDNLGKSCLDGIKATVFPDDRQVVDLHVTKAIDRERPRLEIVVRRLPNS